MTKQEYLAELNKKRTEDYYANKMDFFINPSTARIDPFRIADGLYYVGDKKVCVHLIDTGDGLILIDSGFLGATHLLVDSIWRAGFDPRDIRLIIHTHGHTDHYGASDEFKIMYGCKLAISRVDAEMVREKSKKGNIGGKYYPLAKAPEFDMEIEDGEVIEMGRVKIRCVLSPGHTEGVLSLFFDVRDEGKTYRAGLFGGVGMNTLGLAAILGYGYPKDMPERMLATIEMLRGETVDIHLGNHPGDNRVLKKRETQLAEGGNPFIEKESWHRLLDALEARVHSVIEKNEQLSEELEALPD